MLNWFYISRETRFRLVLVLFLVLYFMPWWFILGWIAANALFLFLVYRKQINFTSRRALDDNLILSPVSGKLVEVQAGPESVKLQIKTGILDDYGIMMPFQGEVVNYNLLETGEQELEVVSTKIEFPKIYSNKAVIGKKRIFVRAGDKASSSAYIGYQTLGGKVSVEIPKECEVLVKPGDKLLSSQTILASI